MKKSLRRIPIPGGGLAKVPPGPFPTAVLTSLPTVLPLPLPDSRCLIVAILAQAAVFYPSFSQPDEAVTDLVNPQISFIADETSQVQVVGQEIPAVQVLERTGAECRPRFGNFENIAPASPVTDALPNQPLPPAFTSFLERLTEQAVAAPSLQDVKEVVSATVNELTAAAPTDELAPDVELNEARQRIKLRRVFDAALAGRTAQELLCRQSGIQANWKPSHQKGQEGQAQKVNCGRCTSWRFESILAEDSVRDGMTDFHNSVNIGNHFPARYKDLPLQAAGCATARIDHGYRQE